MRVARAATYIFLLALFAPFTFAGSPEKSALLGQWFGADLFPNGAKLETVMSLNPDATFTGVATIDQKPFWNYSGSWELEGDKITWTYKNSSRPLPESAKVDIDQVMLVGPKELVLKSQSSGKEHTFIRGE